MNKRLLYGAVCASICPMNEDGSVDYDSVRSLTEHLVTSGIHSLYPNGTNGESLSLTAEERRNIADAVNAQNAGRAVLYIQCGASSAAESFAHARYCDREGIDGIGLMTPVFFPADDDALYAYYDAILPEIPNVNVYAYNIPTRAGCDLNDRTLGRLMEKYANLHGVKYSYPDLQRIQRYVHCCERGASVLIGNDSLATCCMVSGGHGWVSGPAAVFARRHVQLYDALKSGDAARAAVIQQRIAQTADAMSDIPEIPAIKYMLKKLGVIAHDTCRLPLRALKDSEKTRLDVLLDAYLAE